jgi:HSP20 family protein
MANLTKSDNVVNELFDFRRNFDHMFNRFLTSSEATDGQASGLLFAAPPIEAWVDKNEKKYHLSIAMPGVDPKDMELSLQSGNLTVSGERKGTEEKKGKDYLQQEFSRQRLHRTIKLPEGLDLEKLTAQYNNGVLEITAPLSNSALPKRIEIQNPQQAKGAGA